MRICTGLSRAGIIRPFGTYESGGMGRSMEDLKSVCPGAHIGQGLFIRGAEVRNELEAIEQWAGKKF